MAKSDEIELRRCPKCNGTPILTGHVEPQYYYIHCESCNYQTIKHIYLPFLMALWNGEEKQENLKIPIESLFSYGDS